MNPQNLRAMNLLSQQPYHPHLFAQEVPIKDPRGSQMTIFYNGQVIVFDDIRTEQAKEIMSFSKKGTSQNQNNNYANYTFTQSHSSFLANPVRSSVQEHPQVPPTPVAYDLPMTRKASLHRFLEKRKDRIAARAPYQANNPMASLNKAIEESMSWLALTPQSPKDKSESSSGCVLF